MQNKKYNQTILSLLTSIGIGILLTVPQLINKLNHDGFSKRFRFEPTWPGLISTFLYIVLFAYLLFTWHDFCSKYLYGVVLPAPPVIVAVPQLSFIHHLL